MNFQAEFKDHVLLKITRKCKYSKKNKKVGKKEQEKKTHRIAAELPSTMQAGLDKVCTATGRDTNDDIIRRRRTKQQFGDTAGIFFKPEWMHSQCVGRKYEMKSAVSALLPFLAREMKQTNMTRKMCNTHVLCETRGK
jgi:hypothetical protein